ncbi:endonuclease IV [Desulfitobacterium dichloroeliminans LMG P-21439]|uniref:Endonuclease IV n=1 Tax=Desulfitobacterium dichloroeliminans (strain LMG P-21439 / DCA1) TaxID=871963 RepID=L0F897_DESDL|nr:TIM barrel protein [Desulfitobacterium dichloroeliminans]AGA70024.1 endonuclease IV [Desulfitobacterium dichloroeliminans LMG P-21439]
MPLLFGTAGVPISARVRSTEAGVKRVRELKLDAMEIEFVHGVRMGEEKASKIAKIALEENVALSCHGPYWINFNSREPEKVKASRDRLLHSARISKILGVRSVVFHPAFYHDDDPQVVLERTAGELMKVREILDVEGNEIILRPETTGKPSQLGTLREVLNLAQEVPGVLPCIDISHLYARSNGKINTYDEFCQVLEETAQALGDQWVKNAHFHVSGIDYGLKGEKKHLVLAEADFRYPELIKALHTFGVEGLVICESPNLEVDALLMQTTYRSLG